MRFLQLMISGLCSFLCSWNLLLCVGRYQHAPFTLVLDTTHESDNIYMLRLSRMNTSSALLPISTYDQSAYTALSYLTA